MMNTLLALSDHDLDGELNKPYLLRLYPTFIKGELFNNQIDSLEHPELKKYVETYLAEELASVPTDADIVALGQKGPRIVRYAAKAAGVDPRRVVALPHPSGSATGAVRDFYRKIRREVSGPAAACFVIAAASPKDGTYPAGFRCTIWFTGEAARKGWVSCRLEVPRPHNDIAVPRFILSGAPLPCNGNW